MGGSLGVIEDLRSTIARIGRGHALASVGLTSARVIFAEAGKAGILQAAEDAVRARCLGGVAADISGRLTMTASRRLQLAAEHSGVTVLLLRRSRKQDDPATIVPSAATSRWRVLKASPHLLPCPTRLTRRACRAHGGGST